MKSTAVLIYNQFCNFEISFVLEILALAGKPITVFARTTDCVKSEEGLVIQPSMAIDQFHPEEYDSLILPGASDIREIIEDEAIQSFIRAFDGMPIGAISIAPILLLKAGMLEKKPFMAGINKGELLEEGFPEIDLALMHDWDDNLKNPVPEGCIISGGIITSVSYEFVRWAFGFAKLIGLSVTPATFGFQEHG